MGNLSDKYPNGVSGHSYPEWNPDAVYSKDEMISYNGLIYKSLIDNNTNFQPDISSSEWSVYGNGTDEALTMTLGWMTK